MRSVLRAAAVCCGLWSLVGLLIVLSILFAPSTAYAQSALGRAWNAATGQSLRDAVEQNQKDFADREGPSSSAEGSSGGGGAALGAGASPTGRLRSSDHDALKTPDKPGDDNNFAWKTREASVFATGVYAMPGTVLGGQLKLSIFGGQNWLSLKMRDGGGNALDIANGQFGEASNDSAIFGGTALWSQKSTYAMATIVGMWGQTTLKDALDFCDVPTPGCHLRVYEFDTLGFIGSLTAGNVFQLAGSPAGPMLDIRGVASYTQNIGDSFLNFQNDQQKYKFSNWTLTGSATLFSNIMLQNSALLRPYVQGYVRQEIAYRNKLFFDLADPTEVPNSGFRHWDQAHTYAGVELGLAYTLGNMTLGSAIYYDGSADERSLGGRLGASWKLN